MVCSTPIGCHVHATDGIVEAVTEPGEHIQLGPLEVAVIGVQESSSPLSEVVDFVGIPIAVKELHADGGIGARLGVPSCFDEYGVNAFALRKVHNKRYKSE